jgi:hypothetical protein
MEATKMKKILISGIILLGLIMVGCKSQTAGMGTASIDGEAFELYLLADEQMTGADLKNYDLAELTLANKPLISTDDITSYKWENHYINVTQEAYANVITAFSNGIPMDGVPFVIVSGGDRIYAGSFWTPLSSLSFDGVVILQPMDPTNAPLIIMLGYPGAGNFTGEDPRDNSKLKQALQDVGVLE